MTKFWVVTRQVYLKNLRSGTFLWMVLSPLVIALIGGIIGYFFATGQETPKIAVISDRTAYQIVTPTKKAASGVQVNLNAPSNKKYQVDRKITTLTAAKKALRQEKIAGYLTLKQAQQRLTATYVSRDNSPQLDTKVLSEVLTNQHMLVTATQLQLSQAELTRLLQPVTVQHRTVSFTQGKQENRSNAQQAANGSLAMAITVIILLFIMSYAGMIAQEIGAEKGSRIMEIVLSSVSATTQFFGKISGMLGLVITQLLIYGVFGAVGYIFVHHYAFAQAFLNQLDLQQLFSGPILFTILFAFLAICLYTVLAAMLASLVSRQEQIQQAITPLTALGFLGYMGGFLAMGNNNSPVVAISSYIPFVSQNVMTVRYAMGNVTAGPAYLSLGITLITLIGFTFLALQLYRANVLVYSDAGVFKSLRKSIRILIAEQHAK